MWEPVQRGALPAASFAVHPADKAADLAALLN